MPARGLRFLVVEDHPFQRTVMVRLLQSMGANTVHVAEDGHAAVAILRDAARPVDIVISDMSMPRMDGLEFVRRLAELGTPVSVIVSSALDTGTLQVAAAMAQAYGTRLLGVIGKPPTAAKILPLLQAHQAAIESAGDAPAFPLEEIATSWVNGDLQVLFEPQVAASDRRLLALHATPRWRHAELGMLDERAFGAAIRARGLQDEFAWFVLDAGFEACARWRQRELTVGASLPLLLDDLSDVTVASRAFEGTQAHGVDPREVTLCVRAEALGPDARTLENIARLRMHGFALAIEIAGEWPALGAAVLGSISEARLPAELVKRRPDPKMLAVLREHGVRLVACGVDTAAQLQAAADAGCDAVEGLAVSPPLPARWLLQWSQQWPGAMSLVADEERPAAR